MANYPSKALASLRAENKHRSALTMKIAPGISGATCASGAL
jgi:hypothetical protein